MNIRSAATVLALGLGAGLLAAAPASAEGTKFPVLSADTAVQFQAAFNGKCLQPVDGRTDDGAPVVQTTCTGDASQQWQVSDGFAVNVNSGKCLEVPGWSTAVRTVIDQWTCNGGDNQRWGKVNVSGSTMAVVNFNSGLFLDVTGAAVTDNTRIIQWYAVNNPNQRFILNPVG
ncbi:RICIN domain-containing protein [Kitasatospora sp. NPDC001660]